MHNARSDEAEVISANLSQYLIHSRLEIMAILGTLHSAFSMVKAHFCSGNQRDSLLTFILAVRPEHGDIVVDTGVDIATNQRALQAGKITFVAAHDRVKIQFAAESLRPMFFDGRNAFRIPIPATLLRLQRREYFRIAIPSSLPLRCLIPRQVAPASAPAELTIVDISCGGAAIVDTSGRPDIAAGMSFRGCRVPLPELGEVITDVLIRSTFEVTARDGTRSRRAGCQFVSLIERDRALIQRHIHRLERDRRERAETPSR